MASVLVDLIEALGAAHTEATFTEAAFAALGRHLPLASLALVVPAANGSSRRLGAGAEAGPAQAGGAGALERTLPLEDGPAGARATLVFSSSVTSVDERLLDDVRRVLSAALRQLRALGRVARVSRRAHAESRELGDRLKETLPSSVIAVSPIMTRIFGEVVPAVARQSTTVLLLGETGTGKEVVARRIHELSPRARRAYVRVNCGAIPPGLLESALFGHERGAFTGALRAHAGVFERAHDGTLLLDEVGELSADAQVRLLRVLETGELERVGGGRTQRVDVRIIAATHRDLEAMIADGRFRRDLFYRLSVFPIRIPPLRERAADIEPLARHIVAELSRAFGEPPPAIDRRTLERLRSYAWPGNVRELENVIERSLILSRGGPLRVDLPAHEGTRAPLRFDDAIRRCISDALTASGGRVYGVRGAASLLGLKPTTLVSKMQRLGVSGASKKEGIRKRRNRRRAPS